MVRCTSHNCNNEATEEIPLCTLCIGCLETAYLIAMENFGVPEWYECSTCERRFKPEYYESHLPCEDGRFIQNTRKE
jgi:hypothetical protein